MPIQDIAISIIRKLKLEKSDLDYWVRRIKGFSEANCLNLLNIFLYSKKSLVEYKNTEIGKLKKYKAEIEKTNHDIYSYQSRCEKMERTNFNADDYINQKLGNHNIYHIIESNSLVFGKESRLVYFKGPEGPHGNESNDIQPNSELVESRNDTMGMVDSLIENGRSSIQSMGEYLSGENDLTPKQISQLKEGLESYKQELERTQEKASLSYHLIGLVDFVLSAINARNQGREVAKSLIIPEEVQNLIDGKEQEFTLAGGAIFVLGLTPQGRGWRFWKKATKPKSGITFDGEEWNSAMKKGDYKLKKLEEKDKPDLPEVEETREVGDLLPKNVESLKLADFVNLFNDMVFHWESVSKKLPTLTGERGKKQIEVIFNGQYGHMEAVCKWVEGNKALANNLKDKIRDYAIDVKMMARKYDASKYDNILELVEQLDDNLHLF